MKTFKFTGLVLGLLISGAASAELVTKDWQTEGDGLITLNTETGVEWLALTQTAGYTVNQADALTDTGGALAGWQVANKAAVSTLINTLYPTLEWSGASYSDQRSSNGNYSERNYLTEPFLQVASDWVQTRTGGGAWKADYSFLAYGLYADTSVVGWAGTKYAYGYNPNGSTYTSIVQAPYDVGSWSRDTAIGQAGVFLMNNTAAPNATSMSRTNAAASDVHAPVAFGAALLAMMGVGRLRRGNKPKRITPLK